MLRLQTTRAFWDLRDGLLGWRIWHSLAINDIRQRYRRSRIGQFWLTLSLAITIAGMGVVFPPLFHINAEEYVPYVGISLIIWTLISTLTIELAGCCIASEAYLRNYPTPRSVAVYRTIVRNVILFAHNLILIPPLLIFGQIAFSWTILLSIAGLGFLVINAVWVGLFLGPLCARFRDLPQILQNAVGLAMFVTPVMWRSEQMGGRYPLLTQYNPFAVFLELIRAPILGHVPTLHYYVYASEITLIGFVLALPLYIKFRRRIVYWL